MWEKKDAYESLQASICFFHHVPDLANKFRNQRAPMKKAKPCVNMRASVAKSSL